MRTRGLSTLPPARRASAGWLPPGPGAATSAAAAPGSGVVSASIEIRVRVDEALRRWSEFSARTQPGPSAVARTFVPRRVDFEPLAGARSRVSLRLEHRGVWPEPLSARRALEDQLVAFESFVDERGL